MMNSLKKRMIKEKDAGMGWLDSPLLMKTMNSAMRASSESRMKITDRYLGLTIVKRSITDYCQSFISGKAK